MNQFSKISALEPQILSLSRKQSILIASILSALSLILIFTLIANFNSLAGIQCPETGCLCGDSEKQFTGEIDCKECKSNYIIHLGLGYFTYNCNITGVTVCEEGQEIDEYYRNDDCSLEFSFTSFLKR